MEYEKKLKNNERKYEENLGYLNNIILKSEAIINKEKLPSEVKNFSNYKIKYDNFIEEENSNIIIVNNFFIIYYFI